MPEVAYEYEYELWREKFRITEWKDGAIYDTKSEGAGWFDEEVIVSNIPRITNLLYVADSDKSPNKPGVTIRHKK
jgi:hypothetical protein